MPLAILLIVLLTVASLNVWWQLLIRLVRGGPPLFPRLDTAPPPVPTQTMLIALPLAGLFLSGAVTALWQWALGLPAPEPETATLTAVQRSFFNSLLFSLILVAALVGGEANLAACGFRRSDLRGQVTDAVNGLLLAIGPVFLVLWLSAALGLRQAEPEHEFLQLLQQQGTPAQWIWISLTAVVAAPVLEELLFRLLLQGWLERFVPAAGAIAISSLLFCIAHHFPDSLGLLPLALVLGALFHFRRSYLTVVLMHAGFNALNMLLLALADGIP